MPDRRFYLTHAPVSFDEALSLAREQDPTAKGVAGANKNATRVARPDEDDISDAVVLCATRDAAAQAAERAVAVAIADEKNAEALSGGSVIVSSAPRLVFAALSNRLHGPVPDDGEPPAIGEGVLRHPSAVIGASAEIGAGSVIGPNAVIGPGVVLGDECVIGAGASVHFSVLGARVRLFAGARLGEDGFGFAQGQRGAVRIPQLGRLIVGDDVEIGANAAIDRGALGDTVIGEGTKIDNLVHIAHNVQIGRNCFIAGQVGFAGSCELGDGVMLGGQAGVADHISVGAGAKVAAQGGVIRDVPAGESWGGTPAAPHRDWLRAAVWSIRQSKKKADEND